MLKLFLVPVFWITSITIFRQAYAMENEGFLQSNEDHTFVQLKTVGKEDSLCGFSAAWITCQLEQLLSTDSTASLKNIQHQIGPSEENKKLFRRFAQVAADFLVTCPAGTFLPEITHLLDQAKKSAERVYQFVLQETPDTPIPLERKYVAMSLPHGQMVVEILKNQNVPLDHVIVYLDGLGSNVDGKISFYDERSTPKITELSPRGFVKATCQIIHERIKKNGDFVIFTFSGEFRDPFSCWIVVCVRQINEQVQFLILDPANDCRYKPDDQSYFPGLLYQNYLASQVTGECPICDVKPDMSQHRMLALPCCNLRLCFSCLKFFIQKQEGAAVLGAYRCPLGECKKFLPLAFAKSFNPRLTVTSITSGEREPVALDSCQTSGLLKTPSTMNQLKQALADPNNPDTGIDVWLRFNWWYEAPGGASLPGSWDSLIQFLSKVQTLTGFTPEQVTPTIQLINSIYAQVDKKAEDKDTNQLIRIYLQLLGFKGAMLQTILKWISNQSTSGQELKAMIKKKYDSAKEIDKPRTISDSDKHAQVNQLLVEET